MCQSVGVGAAVPRAPDHGIAEALGTRFGVALPASLLGIGIALLALAHIDRLGEQIAATAGVR